MDIDVQFKEPISQMTRLCLLESTIKHFLYFRGQIPCPYEQLKMDVESEILEKKEDSVKSKKKPPASHERKRNQLVKDMEKVFENLRKTFASTEVIKAVIMFGSTTVSPKETYIINFDMNASTQNMDQNGKIPRRLMQKLITNPILNDLKELSLSSMILLLQAPRDSNIEWFLPKTAFRMPQRGTKCAINITSSGSDDQMSSERGRESEKTNTENYDNELLWFQAPLAVKGFRIKDDSSSKQSWF